MSPKNMSVVYELVDVWHRRIDSTIQMLSSNSPTVGGECDNRGFYRCEISDNVGEIAYQYIMDESGKLALFIENITFNLPWNLGTGRLAITESSLGKSKVIIKESQLRSIISETIKRLLLTA